MLVAGKIPLKEAIGHIIAQFAGAIAGAGILYIIVSSQNGFTNL
jgi:glycerol uptake facilitator-like aquaporin